MAEGGRHWRRAGVDEEDGEGELDKADNSRGVQLDGQGWVSGWGMCLRRYSSGSCRICAIDNSKQQKENFQTFGFVLIDGLSNNDRVPVCSQCRFRELAGFRTAGGNDSIRDADCECGVGYAVLGLSSLTTNKT